MKIWIKLIAYLLIAVEFVAWILAVPALVLALLCNIGSTGFMGEVFEAQEKILNKRN